MNTALSLILCSGFFSSAIEVVGTLLGLGIGVGFLLLIVCFLIAIYNAMKMSSKYARLLREEDELRDSTDTIEFRFEYSKDDEDSDKENPEKS